MPNKTTKEIILDSFNNQEFNIKENYPKVTNMFDEIVWLEECSERWIPEQKVKEAIEKHLKDGIRMDLPNKTLRIRIFKELFGDDKE